MATIANLSIAVTINAGNATQSLRALTVQVQSFGNAFQSSMTSSVAIGNLWSQAISRIFSQASQNLGTFISNSIKYSQQFNNALVGLSSVANAFGVDAGGATAAAKALSQDGLLPLRDSAAGLKNLLMTGFGLEDSIKIMNVFKDSAVYARQGFLSYGDAIRTATEGLKNSQSRLVDNVGITKNLSVIMKEYGYQLQDISDKTKGAAARQVLMNGLMREAAAMAGDAARSLQTYTGAVTAVDTAWISLQAEMGNAITTNKSVQTVLTILADTLRDVTEWLTTSGKGAYFVSDALVFMLRYLKVTVVALDLTQQALSWLAIKALEAGQEISDGMKTGYESMLKLVVVLAQLPGGVAALDLMGVSVSQLTQDYAKWATRSQDLSDTITTLKEGSSALSGVLEKGKTRLDAMIKAAQENRGALVDMGAAGRQAGDGLDDLTGGLDRAKKKTKETIDTFRELAAQVADVGVDTAGFGKAIAGIAQKLPAFAKGFESARDAMFGFKEIKAAYEMVTAIGGIENVSRLTVEQMEELEQTLKAAMDRMQMFGITGDAALEAIYQEAQRLPKQIREVRDEIEAAGRDFNRMIERLAAPEAGVKLIDAGQMFGDLFDWNKAKQQAGIVKAQITQELREIKWDALLDGLADVVAELPYLIRDAMEKGESVFAGIGRAAGSIFMSNFMKIAQGKKPGEGFTTGEKVLGVAGVGLESFFGGYDIGASQGKLKGALGGAGTGALSGASMGFMFGGPVGAGIGAAVGGIAGLFGGLFGGSKKAKEERAALEANKKALLEQYGGMAKLQKLAQSLGVDIQKAFDAKNAKQFTAAVDELNKALAEQKLRIAALGVAVEGVNKRAALFRAEFDKIAASELLPDEKVAKMAEAAQRNEAGFARLGLMVRDTFAGLVTETGSGLGAMLQMAPAFQTLEDGVSKFGLTSTAVIDELLKNFRLVNDEALKPLFEQIEANGQVLRGLFDAKALSPEGFQAIAADIGASIQGIVDKGGDMARTLALSQPVLQTLWEAQQQYGAVTDETTQAILTQAEQQGLVGAHMKGVNEKILDVLLAIGKVLGADLPQYFEGLKRPADEAAKSIEGSFKGITIPPIEIPYYYEAKNEIPGPGDPWLPNEHAVPYLASGGIVRRPTLAVIGEAGPEAVVPLSQATALGLAPVNYETTIYLDGEQIARTTAKRIPKIMRGLGVGH
jgi:hypothetical protein